jgi:hypothetical protein
VVPLSTGGGGNASSPLAEQQHCSDYMHIGERKG